MANSDEKVVIDGRELRIVPDGVVSRDAYEQADIRVLHLLKEATRGGRLGESLMGTVRSDGTVKWRLWKVTARRSCALQKHLPLWSELLAREYGAALKASAVVNLNDTIPFDEECRFTTNADDLMRIAGKRWPDRRAKIEQLRPSVIVCGGTYGFARALLDECSEKHEDMGGFFLWRGIPFVKAYHPSFRGKKHSVEYEEFRQRCLQADKWIYKE